MLKVPDLLAVLQQIVRRAMAISPRAPRGGLLLREGRRFAVRALIGFDVLREHALYVPAAAALAGGSAPLARTRRRAATRG
ncbi:hypothetical protein [Sorangium sp. So ce1151]|uniref:hypothetical protein n=1 Tax=Sorangium sp. So ce1151 TaxID=3133332 RepID=UPI003F6293D5